MTVSTVPGSSYFIRSGIESDYFQATGLYDTDEVPDVWIDWSGITC